MSRNHRTFQRNQRVAEQELEGFTKKSEVLQFQKESEVLKKNPVMESPRRWDGLRIASVGYPVPIIDARVVLSCGHPHEALVEKREGRVGRQPLELEPREDHPLVLRPPPLLLLINLLDASALVMQLLWVIAGRVKIRARVRDRDRDRVSVRDSIRVGDRVEVRIRARIGVWLRARIGVLVRAIVEVRVWVTISLVFGFGFGFGFGLALTVTHLQSVAQRLRTGGRVRVRLRRLSNSGPH